MNNRMVAHTWAQQEKSSAQGSHFYFEGRTIYSYGAHFPIARFVDADTVLFTTRSYSISTSKHINYARSAVHHKTVFHVADLDANRDSAHKANFEDYAQRVKQLVEKAARSRVYAESTLGQAITLAHEANAYRALVKLRAHNLAIPSLDPTFVAAVRARVSAQAAKDAAKTKARNAKLARELTLDVARWRAGESVYINTYPETLMRVRGEFIETSRGAEFPTTHGMRAFEFIAKCRDSKTQWHRNRQQIRLGNFAIDCIESNGDVKAGCHYVKWCEIESCAKQLGLL